MSLFWILMLSIGLPVLYVVGIGFTYAKIEDDFFDEFAAGLASLVWPLTLLARSGGILAEWEWDYTPRAERRRAKEIAEAKHKYDIAVLLDKELTLAERGRK